MAKNHSGFTLVELAIVLMIIGLLIGGILRGQELMENARVTSTVQQVKSYEAAKHTFNDEYSALPGDLASAVNRIPNCTTTNACQNGNGNGIIGTAYAKIQDHPFNSAATTENTQFWKHLALTHLISGVDPSATAPTWGKSHPVAKIGGGFVLYYTTNPTDNGLYMSIQNPITTWTTPWLGRGQNPLSPLRAYQIDMKMDDGIPETGGVQAYPNDGFCKGSVNGVTQYIMTNESKDCVTVIKFD